MKKHLITISLLIAANSISAVSFSERIAEARKTFARNWECLFSKNPQPPCTPEEKKRARIAAGVGAGVGIVALGGLGVAGARAAVGVRDEWPPRYMPVLGLPLIVKLAYDVVDGSTENKNEILKAIENWKDDQKDLINSFVMQALNELILSRLQWILDDIKKQNPKIQFSGSISSGPINEIFQKMMEKLSQFSQSNPERAGEYQKLYDLIFAAQSR